MNKYFWVIVFLCGYPAFSRAQVNPELPDSVVGYYFTGSDSVVDSRKVYTYDRHGWILRMDSYERAVPWTYMEQWLHYENTYDGAGNLKTDSISRIIIPSGERQPFIKADYSYTGRNRPSVTFRWYWNFNKNEWGDPEKTEYLYDTDGNLVSATRYDWVGYLGQWSMSGVPHTYRYDESGYLIRENYDAIDVDVPMDFQIEYSYPADTLVEIRTLKKDPKDSVYFLSRIEEKVYHTSGQIKTQTSYYMSSPDGSKDPMDKTVWQYHENASVHLKTEYYRNGNSWSIYVRTHYYYPAGPTGIDLAREAKVSVYPNPASDYINIELLEDRFPMPIKLINSTGSMVKQTILRSKLSVLSVKDLPSGLYLIQSGEMKQTFIKD